MKKKKHAEDQLDLDARFGTAAFPESPSGGGTMRGATGLTTQGNRDRGRSGHFPIPRFDSIRGRFDSGIFASNANGQTNGSAAVNHTGATAVAGGAGSGQIMMHVSGEDLGKVTAEQAAVPTTALSTPSGTGGNGNGSNHVDGNNDVSGGSGSGSYKAPRSTVLGAKGSGGGGGGGAAWGLAMSGEYPDLEGTADPYAVDNAMADTGTGGAARGGM